MIKKRFFRDIFFLFVVGAFNQAFASDAIDVPRDNAHGLAIGYIASFQDISTHGTIGGSSTKQKLSASYGQPKVIGDYSKEQFLKPKISYGIRLSHKGSRSFELQAEGRVITESSQFKFVKFDNPREEEGWRRFTDNLYIVSEVLLGGSTIYTLRFEGLDKKNLPPQKFLEFDNSEDGITKFKQELAVILKNYSKFQKGFGLHESPSFSRTSDISFSNKKFDENWIFNILKEYQQAFVSNNVAAQAQIFRAVPL